MNREKYAKNVHFLNFECEPPKSYHKYWIFVMENFISEFETLTNSVQLRFHFKILKYDLGMLLKYVTVILYVVTVILYSDR